MIQTIERRKAVMNKAILIGNLGKNPEIIHTSGGITIAKFSLATTDRRTDKESGTTQKYTEWHRVIVFGRLAEICGEYLHKGKQVCIEGRIQTSSWEQDGIRRFSTEIIASKMEMLGRKRSDSDTDPDEEDNMPF
jgi:single-strand DNA-binding protein